MHKLYKWTVSPILFALFGAGCRYTPTCSEYAEIAFKRFGVFKGGVLTIKRILRCHPYYHADSHYDPVPVK